MMGTLASVSIWFGLGASVVVILGSIAVGVRWIGNQVKKLAQEDIGQALADIKAQINRLASEMQDNQTRTDGEMHSLRTAFDQHVGRYLATEAQLRREIDSAHEAIRKVMTGA